jgi:hypothetical protein
MNDALLTLGARAGAWLAVNLPNPAAKAPPGGAAKASLIISFIKWGAGISLVAAFFAGIIAFAAGRITNHHGAGVRGVQLMLAALGGAVLYALAYPLLNAMSA